MNVGQLFLTFAERVDICLEGRRTAQCSGGSIFVLVVSPPQLVLSVYRVVFLLETYHMYHGCPLLLGFSVGNVVRTLYEWGLCLSVLYCAVGSWRLCSGVLLRCCIHGNLSCVLCSVECHILCCSL